MRPGSSSMSGPGRSCRKGDGHHTGPASGGRGSGYGARASGDGGKASSSSGQSSLFGKRSVRPSQREPTFLRIRWWEGLQEADGLPVLREATLCKLHRLEIALKFPEAQGCGQMGSQCEFCESRRPRRP
jgi:hypothetical protein